METKIIKKSTKNDPKIKSKRLSPETLKKGDRILQLANKKPSGGKIKFDEVLCLALDLVTEEHIKMLQRNSLKNSDRQENLRKKYSEIYGSVTIEEFIGFTMTPAYFDFLKEHGQIELV